MVNQGDVFLVSLDPTVGHEITKTRPALIVSPNEINASLKTAIIAPMTTKSHPYPTRIPLTFSGKRGFIVLDQVRTVDRTRLVQRLGQVQPSTLHRALDVLREMFTP